MLRAEGADLVTLLQLDLTEDLHVCDLLHLVQVYYFVITDNKVGVGQNSATEIGFSRRRVGTEVRSGGPDRCRELAERLTNGLVQPVPSRGTLQVFLYGAKEIPDYLRRFRDVVFGLLG